MFSKYPATTKGSKLNSVGSKMKLVALMAGLLLSLNAFANENQEIMDLIRYNEKSQLPVELQVLVNEAVVTKCNYIVQKSWEVVESKTTSSPEAPDTLVNSAEYTTILTVLAEDNDGMHPYQFQLRVVSRADGLFTSGTQYRVLSVNGGGSYCSSL